MVRHLKLSYGNQNIGDKMVEKTLEERGNSYGNFNVGTEQFASIMESLDLIHLDKTGHSLKGTDRINLQYIVMKLIRLGATPDHLDSWHDIQGYASLSEIFYKGK